jgi:hypothetical protein
MELTPKMIEAGAAYLCGFSKEEAVKLEKEVKFQEYCHKAEEIFNLMQAASASGSKVTSEDLQEDLADAEPVNDNPNLW